MLILDNTVLSAFIRLDLLDKLQSLVSTALISQEIFEEYSQLWQNSLPDWISITKTSKKSLNQESPLSLSSADLSTIFIALEYQLPLASDDQDLRKFAKHLGIQITGSLALLKTMFQKRIISTKEEYLHYLNQMRKVVYFSDELLKWAKGE